MSDDNDKTAQRIIDTIKILNQRLDNVSKQLHDETIRVDAEIARLKAEFKDYGVRIDRKF